MFEAPAAAQQSGVLLNLEVGDAMGLRGEGTMSAIRGKFASFEVDSESYPHDMSLRILDINGGSVPYEKRQISRQIYR